MSAPRFYISPDRWNDAALRLEGDEARHCAQVLRKEAGDEVVVFNGQGSWARATIASITSKEVTFAEVSPETTPPPDTEIILFQSVPKGSNMELIIEKAVELGVNRIVPVLSERTVVQLGGKDAVKKQEKWQRIALEACKQCGQNWLPKVDAPAPWAKAWAQLPDQDLRLVAALEPDAQSFKAALAGRQGLKQSILMVIGPEGDLSPEEYRASRAKGCVPVTLGAIILRVETAAMYCLSVLRHELQA